MWYTREGDGKRELQQMFCSKAGVKTGEVVLEEMRSEDLQLGYLPPQPNSKPTSCE